MTRLTLPPKPHIANCVGAECPERDTCLRHLRPAYRPHKDHKTGVVTVQRWASYDIERAHFGDCPAKIEVRGMERAIVRASATHAA